MRGILLKKMGFLTIIVSGRTRFFRYARACTSGNGALNVRADFRLAVLYCYLWCGNGMLERRILCTYMVSRSKCVYFSLRCDSRRIPTHDWAQNNWFYNWSGVLGVSALRRVRVFAFVNYIVVLWIVFRLADKLRLVITSQGPFVDDLVMSSFELMVNSVRKKEEKMQKWI